MPGNVSAVEGERANLLAYLSQQRYGMRLTAYGLTDDQARSVPTMSSLSVGGLIKHVTAMERNWMDIVLQRQPSDGAGGRQVPRRLHDDRRADAAGDPRRQRAMRSRNGRDHRRHLGSGPSRAGAERCAMVSRRCRCLVRAMGAAPPDRGDRSSRRATPTSCVSTSMAARCTRSWRRPRTGPTHRGSNAGGRPAINASLDRRAIGPWTGRVRCGKLEVWPTVSSSPRPQAASTS